MAEHALVHKRASSAAEDRRNLNNHIVPLLGHLKASAVTAEDVARMVRSIAAGDTARDEKTERGRRIVKGGKIAANRARALLSTPLQYPHSKPEKASRSAERRNVTWESLRAYHFASL
jgi:hypothetical protein